MRCDKEKGVSNNKGYTWLILFDGTNTKSFNVLEYFWPLIDRQKDFIYVLTLVNNFFYSDQIKDKFIKKMDQYNLRENINYYYYFDCVPGQKQFKYLKEFINFNEDYYFDFVLFYNNPLKYKVKRNDSYQLIIQLKANIGFINLENLDNFFPEEIIDYKEIEKIDKEERRKRRMLEHAEQTLSIDRAYRELQNILLSDYHEKKLERQDTDTSLVHNNNEENNINNDINKSDNKENEEDFFIFGNKLKLLPKIKTKENKRYGDNKKVGERMKVTETNFNKNKIKNRSASKIYIKAKNIQNLNVMTSGKINYNNGERNDIKSISNRLKNIRPINLKEKLTINAKNKFK